MRTKVEYKCSFCGKMQDHVHRLIAGPGGVYICNECVSLCNEIIVEEQVERKAQGAEGSAHWVKTVKASQSDDDVVQRVSQAAIVETRLRDLLAPLTGEVAAARAAIERLAGENGALRERVRALEAAEHHSP